MTHVLGRVVNAALEAYDLVSPVEVFSLPVEGRSNRTALVHTGDGDFIWKAYTSLHDPRTILYEHQLLAWLARSDLPFAVPVPLPTRDGRTLHETDYGWQSLVARFPGHPLDHRNRAHVATLGAALGALHTKLRLYPAMPRLDRFPIGDLHRVHPRLPAPFTLTPADLRLPTTLSYDRLLGWWRDELAQLRPFVDGPYRALSWHIVHNDVIPSNVLVQEGRITAILDFEFAAPDARALDLATSLRHLMRVWERVDEQAAERWDIAQLFCQGYARYMILSHVEIEAVPLLMRLRAAMGALWWMGRALAAGDVRPELQRIEHMQTFVRWLGQHEHRLVDVIEHAA